MKKLVLGSLNSPNLLYLDLLLAYHHPIQSKPEQKLVKLRHGLYLELSIESMVFLIFCLQIGGSNMKGSSYETGVRKPSNSEK